MILRGEVQQGPQVEDELKGRRNTPIAAPFELRIRLARDIGPHDVRTIPTW
jgi:hypothetical protein